jgi:hypothetical protein
LRNHRPRHEHLELFSIGDASLSVRKNAPQRGDQSIKLDRFGVEFLASRGNRLLALARQRMCGQRDDGNVLGLRVAFSDAGRLPSRQQRAFRGPSG